MKFPEISEPVVKEPELITHREPLPGEPDAGGFDRRPPRTAALSGEQRKKSRRKKIWRGVRRTCYVLTGLGILTPVVAFFIAYQFVKVPSTQEILSSQNKVALINYSDGSELTKITPDNTHPLAQYDQIPEHVRQAVYSAEDATFLTNSGFDLKGIARAVWNNLRGGGGGASTISQQYVKNATGQKQATLSRKFFELVTAAKMNNSQPKEDIITAYLNIIPFGRGATGIQEAARAYFDKEPKDLTVSEGALLAGLIQKPYGGDPSKNLSYAQGRWTYVLDHMVTNGWLDQAKRDTQQWPNPLPSDVGAAKLTTTLTGLNSYIKSQVLDELTTSLGFKPQDINQQGLTITTTIDPKAQQAAEAAYTAVMVETKQPDYLRASLVAVEPKSGGVIAYHAGSNGTELDWAQQLSWPGSSFKPFVFTADLQKGGNLYETYDGSSPRVMDNRPVSNAPGTQCSTACTVKEAMTMSINTVFFDMGLNKVGTRGVANAAFQAGIPKVANNTPLLVGYDSNKKPIPDSVPDGNISIGGGNTRVRPIDMAYAYSTFANNGTRAAPPGDAQSAPHFIDKIVDSQNVVRYQYQQRSTPAFDQDPTKSADIARNVTESIIDVPHWSHLDLSDHRPVAGKTGTEQAENNGGRAAANSTAWMAGYTPQVSAAVWVGALGAADRPIQGNYLCPTCGGAGHDIFGSREPGIIWQKFMDGYLKDTAPEKFPPLTLLGKPPAPSTTAAPVSTTDQQTSTKQTETTTTTTAETTTKAPKPPHTKPTMPTCSLLAPCNTATATAPTTTTAPGGGGNQGGGLPPPTGRPTG